MKIYECMVVESETNDYTWCYVPVLTTKAEVEWYEKAEPDDFDGYEYGLSGLTDPEVFYTVCDGRKELHDGERLDDDFVVEGLKLVYDLEEA